MSSRELGWDSRCRACVSRAALLWMAVVGGGTLGCGSVDESSGLIGSSSTIKVAINELMSSSSDGADWIELYNLGDEAVSLAGFFVGDNPDSPLEAQLGEGVEIAGHGVVLLQAGCDGTCTEPLAVDIGLSNKGESVVLSDAQGLLVDSVEFGASAQDQSYARHPDGTGKWGWCDSPTPGELNGSACGG